MDVYEVNLVNIKSEIQVGGFRRGRMVLYFVYFFVLRKLYDKMWEVGESFDIILEYF